MRTSAVTPGTTNVKTTEDDRRHTREPVEPRRLDLVPHLDRRSHLERTGDHEPQADEEEQRHQRDVWPEQRRDADADADEPVEREEPSVRLCSSLHCDDERDDSVCECIRPEQEGQRDECDAWPRERGDSEQDTHDSA